MFWTSETVCKLRNLRKLHILQLRVRSVICIKKKKKQTKFPRGRDNLRNARSNFTVSQTNQKRFLCFNEQQITKELGPVQELLSPSVMRKREELWGREWLHGNLVPRVFIPYCAGLTKRATLESSVTRSILIGLQDNTNGRK